MAAAEVVGSKSFLSRHFCELCFWQMFSHLWPDSVRMKIFVGVKGFMLPFESGAKRSMQLEGEDQRNLLVLHSRVESRDVCNLALPSRFRAAAVHCLLLRVDITIVWLF